jgi:hypothetical protein
MLSVFTRLDEIVSRRPVAVTLLLVVGVYRLGVGLCSAFWYSDEIQIYLIGLKSYTTGTWPFFGPDLVLGSVGRIHQIPGALQGLLVGLPFHVAPFPEAPYVLLNLLSLSALVFLAWYGQRRVPVLPRWLVYGLALTLPWTLFYSTHVVNPSYVLFGAVLFWIGLVEATVFPDTPLLPRRLADYLQGFGLVWVLQLHMSWILLVPFAALSGAARLRRGDGLRALGAFLLGCATTGSLLVPTLVSYGVTEIGNTAGAVRFNPANARDLDLVVVKSLSFASYTLPRFIGTTFHERLAWLTADWRLAPFAFFAVGVGFLQPIAFLLLWFRRSGAVPGWTGVKILSVATILLTWTAFLFTVREPWALTFYLTLPMMFLYSLFCYAWFLKGRWWLAFAALVLGCGIVTETALAWRNLHDRSMYTHRDVPVKAITERDHRLLGDRRPGTFY